MTMRALPPERMRSGNLGWRRIAGGGGEIGAAVALMGKGHEVVKGVEDLFANTGQRLRCCRSRFVPRVRPDRCRPPDAVQSRSCTVGFAGFTLGPEACEGFFPIDKLNATALAVVVASSEGFADELERIKVLGDRSLN